MDWRLLADVGWLGLEVPERCGGAGAGFAEVAVVLEELGRARAASAYLGFAVLAVGALELLAPFPERDQLLAACRLRREQAGRRAGHRRNRRAAVPDRR